MLLKAACNQRVNYDCYTQGNLCGDLSSIVRKTDMVVFVWRERGAGTNSCSCSSWLERCSVFRPGAVDLPLFDCFVLVHIDGGDGVLGARLHLPVHLPLGVLGLGLQQVHPLLGFDPAGNGGGKRMGRVNFIRGDDLCARSEVSAPCVQQTSSLYCVMAKAIPQMNQ